MIARGLAVLGLCMALATAAHGSVRAGPLADAGAFLAAAQQQDGGFAEAGGTSDESLTAWGTLGLVASGGSTDARSRALSYLRSHEEPGMSDTDAALVALARLAAGDRPDTLLARLRSLKPGPLVNAEIWAILALRGAGEPAPRTLVRAVLAAQSRSGGWSWLRGGKPDSNDTAAALEALRAARVGGAPIVRGLRALRAFRKGDSDPLPARPAHQALRRIRPPPSKRKACVCHSGTAPAVLFCYSWPNFLPANGS